MSAVFLDTVGILAVLDADDQWHNAAATVFDRIIAENLKTVTTDYIFLECGNAASRRPYRKDVAELRVRLKGSSSLIEPTTEDIEVAWRAFERGEAGQAGIIDHVSFAVMRRLGLTEAFTNDKHFVAAGYCVLF